jgi:allantoate deiminase
METPAVTVMRWADALGGVSEEPRLLVRPFGSAAMERATELLEGWMREAGMAVRRDVLGNLVGRYEGRGDGGTLLLGSHFDTVRDAGKYDGPLGVLVAIACVKRLHDAGERLPYALEVVAFADEEGLRFGTAYLGSSVFAGAFDRRVLDLVDAQGSTLAELVRSRGVTPEQIDAAGRAGGDLIGYLEVHIEQGPVLERLGLPVGVVSAINGQSRVALSFQGEAGHAGTVPMAGRRDALCAGAEFVLAAEERARRDDGLVATVGELAPLPGASNVIPGECRLTLDLRHAEDRVRERARDDLRSCVDELAERRALRASWQVRQEAAAAATDAQLTELLVQAVAATGTPVERLPSGAGHDAAQLASLTPIAMLFVRCRGGISHNPAESVETEDVAVAIDVVSRYLGLLAESDPRLNQAP